MRTDDSSVEVITSDTTRESDPTPSPDGKWIAFSSDRGNSLGSDYNIWTLDLRSGELKHVITTVAPDGGLMVRFVLRSTEAVARIRKHLPDDPSRPSRSGKDADCDGVACFSLGRALEERGLAGVGGE